MVSSAQVGKIWLRVRLVLHMKKIRIRTNPGQVGSVKQPAKSRPGVSYSCWTLTDPQKDLLRSQGGPLASAPFISMPIDKVSRIDSQSFRLLFLRRLRQPLSLIVRSCRCGRLLEPWPSSVCVSSCCGVGSSWIYLWRTWQHESAEKQAEGSE